jgi:hypothetical protein
MAQKLDEKGLVTFKELLMANSKMVDTLAQLLIQKGVFTEEEFYAKLKEVNRQYQAGKRTGHGSTSNWVENTSQGLSVRRS